MVVKPKAKGKLSRKRQLLGLLKDENVDVGVGEEGVQNKENAGNGGGGILIQKI